MRLRVCPPMLFAPLKEPPAKILPSACTAMAKTVLFAFGLKRISQAGRGIEPGDAVARLSADAVRTAERAARQNLAVRLHRDGIDSTLFAFGLKAVSSVPSGFNRAMRLRVTAAPPLGASVVKSPPIRILPSGWTTTTRTAPLAFGSKPSSADCPRTAVATNSNSTTIAVIFTQSLSMSALRSGRFVTSRPDRFVAMSEEWRGGSFHDGVALCRGC